jgi:hypothetical protein
MEAGEFIDMMARKAAEPHDLREPLATLGLAWPLTLDELKNWKCPKCGGTTGVAEEGGVGGTAKVCECEKFADRVGAPARDWVLSGATWTEPKGGGRFAGVRNDG